MADYSGAYIAGMYGKNNTQFADPVNAGVSGTGGIYGRFGELPRYNPTPYAYQDFNLTPGLTSLSAKRADLFSNVMSQAAQAGQQENAQRGQAILSGYSQRIANNRNLADQQMGYVDAYGASQRRALNEQKTQQLAASRQSALRRGLGNTTIQDSLDRGVNADYSRANMQLEDQLLQNRLNQNQTNIGLENQLTGDRLGFLASIENPYPSLADISNLYLQSGVLQETAGSRK